MIKKLRYKFIGIASFAVLVVLFFFFFLVIGASYLNLRMQTKAVTTVISENGGKMMVDTKKETIDFMTQESQYGTRYFSVILDDEGNIGSLYDDHIAIISEDDVYKLTNKAAKRNAEYGFIKYKTNYYSYQKSTNDNNEDQIVFVDATQDMVDFKAMVRTCILIGIASFLFFVLLISALSKKAIEPSIRNIENQKAFITNAGHELKTPLAVISANTEVLEMVNGKNEWTESIMNQTKRLSSLVNNFIVIARMDEREDIVLTDINISDITKEVCTSFKTVIEQQKKKEEYNITDGIVIKGDEKIYHELVNILVDNACKYCDDEGVVKVSLEYRNRIKKNGAKLIVSNDYKDGENVDYSRFFDRFYREDKSHNSKKQGYGIGLSMAESIVTNLKGKISVSYSNGRINFVVMF